SDSARVPATAPRPEITTKTMAKMSSGILRTTTIKMRKVELTHLFITTLRAANTPIGMANTAPRKVAAKAIFKVSTISRKISAAKPPDDGGKNSARVAGSSVSPTRNSRSERSTANQDNTVKITIVAITSTRLTRSALHGGLMLVAGAATAT